MKLLMVDNYDSFTYNIVQYFGELGAEVTVVEALPRILPVEDEEISAFAHKAFEKQGMKIMAGAAVKGVKKGANNVTVTVAESDPSAVTVDLDTVTVEVVVSAGPGTNVTDAVCDNAVTPSLAVIVFAVAEATVPDTVAVYVPSEVKP